ncbi:hypothetical protein [Saccharibacillus brassicae]|uniref:Uncharacterized protein n=1 Tax=Saccharibacillus brassicae TaxID=2583377 RepID=A0A4Y6V3P3_SACBS|nr:hypothetical protein [Saccharibacillus brassicae]QDH23478.1 hypothetical protein FFV09_23000 [Saccharibacillus brassicae]
MKESDLYQPLKLYLERLGYTVYPEIEISAGRPRADIVAVKDERLLIVEMKTSFGLAVMEQADHWASGEYAHQTYIAVPWRDRWQVPMIAQRALRPAGIGVLQVDVRQNPNDIGDLEERFGWLDGLRAERMREDTAKAHQFYEERRVRVCLEAAAKSEAPQARRILDVLTPYHLAGPDAGGKAGGHISAYRVTMIRIREYLEQRADWTTAREIEANVETHFQAADNSASIKQALLAWETGWCESCKIKNKLYFKIRWGSDEHVHKKAAGQDREEA